MEKRATPWTEPGLRPEAQIFRFSLRGPLGAERLGGRSAAPRRAGARGRRGRRAPEKSWGAGAQLPPEAGHGLQNRSLVYAPTERCALRVARVVGLRVPQPPIATDGQRTARRCEGSTQAVDAHSPFF